MWLINGGSCKCTVSQNCFDVNGNSEPDSDGPLNYAFLNFGVVISAEHDRMFLKIQSMRFSCIPAQLIYRRESHICSLQPLLCGVNGHGDFYDIACTSALRITCTSNLTLLSQYTHTCHFHHIQNHKPYRTLNWDQRADSNTSGS